MKKLFLMLGLAGMLFLPVGCSNNANDENYENSDPNNLEEDLYEEEMGAPEDVVGEFQINNITYFYNI